MTTPSENSLPPLIRRQRAVAYVLSRFRGVATAPAVCAQMARTLLVKMGHKGLPKLPPCRSVAEVRKAMKDRGWSDVSEMLDELLPGRRIPPAMMWSGDLAMAESEDGLGAIWVKIDTDRMLGWHQGSDEAVVIAARKIVAAWRT